MADVTLQTISDTLLITQQSVEDLRLAISGFDTRISDNTDDITTLQNPPAAVPPGLISWLALSHTFTEVDPILDTRIDNAEATIIGHTTSIGTLTTNLATETSDRATGDTDLQTNIDDLQTQVTTNLATLTQEISDRSTLSASVGTQIGTLTVQINAVAADLATETSTTNTSLTALTGQMATVNQALQTAQTQITLLQGIGVDPLGAQASQIATLTTIANDASTSVSAETTARIAADTSLQSSITGISSSVTGIQTNLDSEVATRTAADAAINVTLGSLGTTVAGNTGSIASETAARIAADSTLTGNVATNTTDIATNASNIANEITNRGNADTALQGQITTNTGNIATNTANIVSNTSAITGLKAHFGVVKDGGGYVTSYRINDDSLAAANFNLRNLNNDLRLQNPGFVGKYFAPVAVASFSPSVVYDTQYNVGPATLFHGTDAIDRSRNVNVYSTLSVGINGSVFKGVDYSTLGDTQRLGQVLTTFAVEFSGYVNSFLSVWYRIKTAPGDTTQRWFPVAMVDVGTMAIPGQRSYELASGSAVVQISVTSNLVVEFGLTALSTVDASMTNASFDNIYNGRVKVTALNMVTIS